MIRMLGIKSVQNTTINIEIWISNQKYFVFGLHAIRHSDLRYETEIFE